jgi:hypothetical protein
MLRSLLDLAPGQAEPYLPLRNDDPLDRGDGNDMVSLVEVMSEADDDRSLAGARSRRRTLERGGAVDFSHFQLSEYCFLASF